MAFDRSAAREAGYSSEEIDAYIAANPHVETKEDKDQAQAAKLPSPDEVLGASVADNPSAEVGRGAETAMTGAMGVGMGAAGVGIPVLAYKAGKAIMSPAAQGVRQFAQQGMDVANRGVGAMEGRTAVDAAREARMAQRPGFGGGSAPTAPVAPTGTAPLRPVIPAGSPPAPTPSMASRVQAAAAQRIANLPAMGEMLGGAARMAGRVLGPAGLAMQTTDLGPKTPQTGRMRGMEINPLTGAPWTPQQIAQYEANPGQFDSQMTQPQFRR